MSMSRSTGSWLPSSLREWLGDDRSKASPQPPSPVQATKAQEDEGGGDVESPHASFRKVEDQPEALDLPMSAKARGKQPIRPRKWLEDHAEEGVAAQAAARRPGAAVRASSRRNSMGGGGVAIMSSAESPLRSCSQRMTLTLL